MPDHIITIDVNNKPKQVPQGRMTHAQITALAFPPQPGQPAIAAKITYLENSHSPVSKTLPAGQSVLVHEGMYFTVDATNES